MKSINYGTSIPHLCALGIFILLALIFCKPALEGKVLQQSDIVHWKGMSKDISDYKEVKGTAPLWTNSMFSGMPGFQIATNNNNILPYYANEAFALFIPKPFRFFILACLGFYFLCWAFGISPWIGIIGALGYAYASYSSIIVAVGHETKMLSMAYVPALIGAMQLIFSGRLWIGTALTALFSAILISHNHYQIDYYFMIIALGMSTALLAAAINNKTIGSFFKPAMLALMGGLIGVLTNAVMIFTTYDYSKATMRGGQAALNTKDTGTTETKGGLDTGYAFAWSYGKAETMTLMVPNVYGGASQLLGEDSKLIQTLNEKNIPQELGNQLYGAFPAYWGPQPSTSGPVYVGAVFCFLFLLGIFLVRGPTKWWILAVTALAIIMSWGKNFATFNTFLFEHLPLYNKFRAPSMILVIPQLTIPLLGMLALNKVFSGELSKEELLQSLKRTALAAAAVVVVAIGLYMSFDYTTANDRFIQQQLTNMSQGDTTLGSDIIKSVAEDRKKMFGDDLIRSVLLMAIAFMLIFLYNKKIFNTTGALAALICLSAFDVLGVSARYLNAEKFLEPEEYEGNFSPTPADLQIKQDTGNHYRVFNLTQDVFNDAITSYHHRSVGGYHAAKLSIYQDLIENQLSKQLMNMEVLNMLDTRYIIAPDSIGNPSPSFNPNALGAVWLVNEIKWVKDPKDAMKALDSFNAASTAIIEEKDRSSIKQISGEDSSASIQLTQPGHDTLIYSYAASTPQFAVFSEVFYDKGWKAYVDGQERPIVRTNYALRGLSLEPGQHEIQFRFEPASFLTGYSITRYAQWVLVVLLIVAVAITIRKKKSIT